MIKGIDTQVAFQRVTETGSRDLNAQLKRPEIVRDFAVQLGQQKAEREAEQVMQLIKKDGAMIKGFGERESPQQKRKKKKNPRAPVSSPDGLDMEEIRRFGLDIEV